MQRQQTFEGDEGESAETAAFVGQKETSHEQAHTPLEQMWSSTKQTLAATEQTQAVLKQRQMQQPDNLAAKTDVSTSESTTTKIKLKLPKNKTNEKGLIAELAASAEMLQSSSATPVVMGTKPGPKLLGPKSALAFESCEGKPKTDEATAAAHFGAAMLEANHGSAATHPASTSSTTYAPPMPFPFVSGAAASAKTVDPTTPSSTPNPKSTIAQQMHNIQQKFASNTNKIKQLTATVESLQRENVFLQGMLEGLKACNT